MNANPFQYTNENLVIVENNDSFNSENCNFDEGVMEEKTKE
jgi:hypothetical protein